MKENQFDALARRYFGEVLIPFGFTCEESRYANFYRQVSEDIVHFIIPDLGGGGAWYDVKVFASSPKIEPQFYERFPDDIGIPSGSLSFLHPATGVGSDQKRFHCKTEDGFARGFLSEVESALRNKALPYLDGIVSLESLIPKIRHDLYLGAALWHSGDKTAARPLLLREAERLSSIKDETGRIATLLTYLQQLLSTS